MSYILLFVALILSMFSGYFSVIGLAEVITSVSLAEILLMEFNHIVIYYWSIIGLGIILEICKLVSAAWLHSNWHNKAITFVHKAYMLLAIIVLMIFTSWGIYGYLNKGRQEMKGPAQQTELQIKSYEDKIKFHQGIIDAQNENLKRFNAIIDSRAPTNATSAQNMIQQQQKDRAAITKTIEENNASIKELQDKLLPLKQKVDSTELKLGYAKNVAAIFGINDPSLVITFVILLLMFSFDPLAVILVISAVINMKVTKATDEENIKNKEIKEIEDQLNKKIEEQTKLIEDLKSNFDKIPSLAVTQKLDEKINHHTDEIKEIIEDIKSNYTSVTAGQLEETIDNIITFKFKSDFLDDFIANKTKETTTDLYSKLEDIVNGNEEFKENLKKNSIKFKEFKDELLHEIEDIKENIKSEKLPELSDAIIKELYDRYDKLAEQFNNNNSHLTTEYKSIIETVNNNLVDKKHIEDQFNSKLETYSKEHNNKLLEILTKLDNFSYDYYINLLVELSKEEPDSFNGLKTVIMERDNLQMSDIDFIKTYFKKDPDVFYGFIKLIHEKEEKSQIIQNRGPKSWLGT